MGFFPILFFILKSIILSVILLKKYRSKNTMMDERLIGYYKDEIKQEVAQALGIEYQEDGLNVVEYNTDLLNKSRDEYFKNNPNPTSE